MENQSIQQANSNLINKVRKKSNKKKTNFKWVSILWIFGVIAIAILILFLVFNALKPIQPDPYSTTINVTLKSEDVIKNTEEIKKLKFPSDYVDYNLEIVNDLQSQYDVFLRFNALTYVEGDFYTPNVIKLIMPQDNKDNFFYDEDEDKWYYYGKIGIGETLTICERIGIDAGKATNQLANKTVGFYLSIDAIKTTGDLWNNANSEWIEEMTARGFFTESGETGSGE